MIGLRQGRWPAVWCLAGMLAAGCSSMGYKTPAEKQKEKEEARQAEVESRRFKQQYYEGRLEGLNKKLEERK